MTQPPMFTVDEFPTSTSACQCPRKCICLCPGEEDEVQGLTADLSDMSLQSEEVRELGPFVHPEDHPRHLQRIRQNKYSFSLNTNKRPASRDNAYEIADMLSKACKIALTKKMILDTPGVIKYYKGDKDAVRFIRSEFKVEMGENYRYGARMHVHGEIVIAHNCSLALYYKAFVLMFNGVLEKLGATFRIHAWKIQREKLTMAEYTYKYIEVDDKFTNQ